MQAIVDVAHREQPKNQSFRWHGVTLDYNSFEWINEKQDEMKLIFDLITIM